MNGMQRIRFGIIGAMRGAIVVELAHHLRDEMTVTAICDVRLERAQALAAKCDAMCVYANDAQLLARDDVDAVFIATPDHLHAEMTVRALRRASTSSLKFRWHTRSTKSNTSSRSRNVWACST
jgi:predicted dehydrogenase